MSIKIISSLNLTILNVKDMKEAHGRKLNRQSSGGDGDDGLAEVLELLKSVNDVIFLSGLFRNSNEFKYEMRNIPIGMYL